MAATLQVEKKKEGEFRVTVREGRSQSSHLVTVKQDYYEQLTGERIAPEELVRQSFEFLLAREPKESILSQFDLRVIAHYFPEYEREIKQRLGGSRRV
ncbi:MAG: hypothetical protein ACE5H2_01030 [Terriglobia bacterium]